MLAREVTDKLSAEFLTAGRLVVFAACDTKYVSHAVPLIRSLEVFSSGQTILLHLVNPTESALQRLEVLSDELVNARLVLSRERTDLSSLTDAQRRTYYACARFIRLAELMEKSACDFLVLDVDSLVVGPIERDFSDKPEAEICLRRRTLEGVTSEQLAVAAGSVWSRSTPGSRQFFKAVSADIQSAFADSSAAWHLDQVVLKRRVDDASIPVVVRNIKAKYADWDFRDDSVVWQGKGKRKFLDLRYLLLHAGLSDSRQEALQSKKLYDMFLRFSDRTTKSPIDRRLKLLVASRPSRAVFLLPRLDLPWKRQGIGKNGPPKLESDTLELRLYWVRFVSWLANTCERAGIHVVTQELPAWEITREYIETLDAAVVVVPHRCALDFEPGPTPVLFYMQEYFRWLFVVDEQGWSAASTVYPIRVGGLPSTISSSFEEYRSRLARGELQSKFAQPTVRKIHEHSLFEEITEQVAEVPAPSIFFPLQIPHDQSIQLFCDFEFDDVLEAVVRWGEKSNVVVKLKPHPANMQLMMKYVEKYPEGTWLRWCNENIHDLIADSQAVFTVNSGVGFEALLHGKPVVTFGRAEYDCVSVQARIDAIGDAWQKCLTEPLSKREAKYRKFFDWFTTVYAVDLSRPEAASLRLAEIAARISALARGDGIQKSEVTAR